MSYFSPATYCFIKLGRGYGWVDKHLHIWLIKDRVLASSALHNARNVLPGFIYTLINTRELYIGYWMVERLSPFTATRCTKYMYASVNGP